MIPSIFSNDRNYCFAGHIVAAQFGMPANDIMSFWQAAYVRSGKKVKADKMTGQQFGKSQRTVAWLQEGWQALA